ncbi:siderophore ABC transporter substrate-binding protein [Enterococcus pallens]|uniref:Iron ABC transporter substrate-binding protein n=1 Tax=Enterococcus pallens ATCC BAA-351 TaxID=1158607 RepID=R2T100_9ENTE|nr:siderophore ABC transporter substrate-binding protein [Enterococcus pallens]EOH93914.1 iron ABC transporter substrate-binding protein [Enterococcus pallens ATCC BAA-351]EOU24754.1 iron ABC transporter substrate-binding protein [Enterococcus pallens ATCC BAA-351]OJG77641.1 iron ABC transporter substrate-binding protein [Enterococcus pallens]
MKKYMVSLSILLLGFGLAGCGASNDGTTDSSGGTAQSSAAKAETLEVTDSNGKVTVPKNPKKVVVFDNGSLDTIDALGAGDSVVGAATDNLPAYLSDYKEVDSAGGIKEPDLEKINQMQPDLIIISGRQSDFQDQLKEIAPTMYLAVDTTDTWNSIKHNVETLGQIFDKESEAKKQLTGLETSIKKTKTKAEESKDKALTVLVNEGQLSAYGKDSRFGIIYDTFGFAEADDTIEASTHGQSVSYEYVLDKNPDVLFVVDRTKAIGGDDTGNNVADNELVAQTTAGKENKVITLQSDVWYLSGGGLESTKMMLEDVNKALE